MRDMRPMRTTRRMSNLAATRPGWFTIKNSSEDAGPILVHIYDEIGFFGTSAQDFVNEVMKHDGDMEFHINSPGGDVFDGIAIFNTMAQRSGMVRVVVDGLAASAASFIAQAASPGELLMSPHSQMMIHDGFAMAIGNEQDLRSLADKLSKASDNIAGIYAARSGRDVAYWRERMRAETWYADQEAVDAGLADAIKGASGGPGNSWDLTIFNNTRIRGASNHPPYTGTHTHAHSGFGKGDGGDAAQHEHAHDHQNDNDHDHHDDGDADDVPSNTLKQLILNAAVDESAWDGPAAMKNAGESDNPGQAFASICAGRREGPANERKSWALPHHKEPGSAPNAAGVRNALARLSSTEGLTNESAARAHLEAHMRAINPDWEPSDNSLEGLFNEVREALNV